MRRLRKLSSLAGIWLTAFMTLVAGAPHLHCVCPNGRVKLYCLSFFSRTSCCEGSCCPAVAQDEIHPQEQACCCRAARHDDNRDLRIHGTGCKKTLIAAEASGFTVAARDAGQELDASACVAVTEPPALASMSATNAERIRRNPYRPPPADLLNLLQHFNI
ncbi:MAG TPA: hypothetical protein VH643_07155 [Gemmataceae bacterium]|jgi:hypothetical protein